MNSVYNNSHSHVYSYHQVYDTTKEDPDRVRDFYDCTFFVNRPDSSNPNSRNYPKIIELANDVCRAELAGTGTSLASDARMEVRDLDFAKWTSYLTRFYNFNPDIHVLQFCNSKGTLKDLDPTKEMAWKACFAQDAWDCPGHNFSFRVVKKNDKFRPFGWVDTGMSSGGITVQDPATKSWLSGKRARPSDPDEPDEGGLLGWGNTSKRVRIEKYEKPADDDEDQFKDVDENDPNGDGDDNNDDDDGYISDDQGADGDDDDEINRRILERQMDNLARDCEQFDEEKWKECCQFFGMDAGNESPEQTANINLGGGQKASFKVYQAYGIYVMMLMSRGLAGGGFLSDEQGLGKTRQGLGFCIMEHILAEAWQGVADDRKQGGTKHNPLAAASTASSCPSEARGSPQFPIPCPCWNGSISSQLEAKLGPSLIICPPNLITNWGDEFGKMTGKTVTNGVTPIPGPGEFNMQLVLLHETHKLSTSGSNRVSIWLRNEQKKLRNRAGLSKYIVISSEGSFNNHAGQVWGLNVKEGKDYPRVRNLRWGRALKDEHHLAHNITTNAVIMLRDLLGDPHTWLLSGTPFEGTPANINGYINILRNRKTDGSEPNEEHWGGTNFHHAQEDEFKWIIGVFNAQVKAPRRNKDRRNMIDRFSTVLKALMIRRTTKSLWFKEKMVKLKPNSHHKEIVQANPQYEGDLNRLREKCFAHMEKKTKKGGKVGGIATKNASRMPRLCATFPALASIIRRDGTENWTLTQDTIEPEWYTDATGSPYAQHLDEMVNSSEKITTLATLLDAVQTGRDYKGRPEKVIILSSFPGVAFTIDLWIKTNRNERAILIHGKTVDKNAYIEGFQEYELSAFKPKGHGSKKQKAKYREGKQATILISTPALIGVGYTLTRSFRVILMEPAYLKRDEDQGFARVKRIGQENSRTHTHRLENHGSQAELAIMARQKNRTNLSSAAFKKSTDPSTFGEGAYDPAKDDTDEHGYTMGNRERQNELQSARYDQNYQNPGYYQEEYYDDDYYLEV